jgi:hypothetical protein
MTVHKGGCHCGKIRFEVEAPAISGLCKVKTN